MCVQYACEHGNNEKKYRGCTPPLNLQIGMALLYSLGFNLLIPDIKGGKSWFALSVVQVLVARAKYVVLIFCR